MAGVTPRPFAETPVVFGRHGTLVGTACRPTTPGAEDAPFVVFINAGIIHRAGPNRFYVLLARALAEHGVESLRFDLSGVGDSLMPATAEARPQRERVDDDLDDVVDFVRTRFGADRFVLLGLCSGADHALWTMGRRPEVVGSILLDVNVARTPGYYVRYYGRRLVSPAFWASVFTGRHPLVRRAIDRVRGHSTAEVWRTPAASPTFTTSLPREAMRRALARISDRGGKILAIFTGGVEFHYNHRGQFRKLFRSLDLDDSLDEVFQPQWDHTFSRPEAQAWLIDTTVRWVTTTPFPSPRPEDLAEAAAAAPGGGQ